MNLLKAYFKILILQLTIIILAVLTVTAVRYFDPDLYKKVANTYSFYASYDTDTKLVYDGNADWN